MELAASSFLLLLLLLLVLATLPADSLVDNLQNLVLFRTSSFSRLSSASFVMLFSAGMQCVVVVQLAPPTIPQPLGGKFIAKCEKVGRAN